MVHNHASPLYLTESTDVDCGIKSNAKLLLLLRAHTEHLALGDGILWPQSSSRTTSEQEIPAATLAGHGKSQRTMTTLMTALKNKSTGHIYSDEIRPALSNLPSSPNAVASLFLALKSTSIP